MPTRIGRAFAYRQQSRFALTTALGTTPEIGVEEFAVMMIFIPAGSTITTLTFYAAPWQASSQSPPGTVQDTPAATFQQLYSSANVAITLTVAAGRCYQLPVDLGAAGAIKIVANAAGSVEISMKG